MSHRLLRFAAFLAIVLGVALLAVPAAQAQRRVGPHERNSDAMKPAPGALWAGEQEPLSAADATIAGLKLGPTGISTLYAPSEADDSGLRQRISAISGAPVDYFDARTATPTLDQLQQYGCIYTWANYGYSNRVQFGDNLADFVDAGGVVVLGSFAAYTSGNSLGGRVMQPGYSPVSGGSNHFSSSNYVGDGTTLLYENVLSLAAVYRDFLTLQGDGLRDGNYADGEMTGAYRPDFAVVYTNGAENIQLGGSGDWEQFVVNACGIRYLAAEEGGRGVDPNRQLGRQVHLPILNFQGQDDVCRTWIEVQVVGPEFSKAVLVTWGEPGFCPPQCAGPLKVECTGLLKPGATWNFLGAQIPTGSKSGMLFKFTTKQLSAVAPDLVPPDDIVADYMCETLFFGVVGDCDDYRRFKKAYNESLEFAGISMGAAAGKGYLAVDVLRACPGDVTPGVEVTSMYNGLAGTHLGSFDPVYGGYGYYIALLYADKGGFNSIMYIQNGGLECSSVEIWFKAQDDCLRARICEIFTLAPGETYQFDASDCVGPDWQGSAWLRSTQPLGVVIDIIGHDLMMTYMGEPAAYAYAMDPEDPDDDEIYSEHDWVVFGPLMYSEYQGWDSGVQVFNGSPVTNAKVKVYFLDRSGDVITTLVDWICPRGSQTFFLPVVADLPGNWVGSIRVESQEWWTPGSPAVAAPHIAAGAVLIKYSDAARTQAIEGLAYNLLPEHKIYIWQIGGGKGGTFSGVGLIAIPSLLKDLEGTGVTSEVAIVNVVPKPGFTDFAIYIYDQNGLLDYVCQKLNEKQVEYIDLQTWGYVNPGFKGSAIISAVFWEHDVFSPTGLFQRNLVGLGAVAVQRSGTRLGEDVPGDEAAGERGIPFAAPGGKKDFDWEGPNLPNCPGIGRIPAGF